jgi:ribosomal protein S12 methylthiotransferase accessory factor
MDRLTPGAHLYRIDAGDWRISADGNTFAKVTGPNSVLQAFQFDGARTSDSFDGSGDLAEPAVLSALIESLRERGLIEACSPDRRHPTTLVLGDNPIADAAFDILTEGGSKAGRLVGGTQIPADVNLSEVDAIITCEGWLPDERWQAMDARVRSQGVLWQRVHAEGSRFYVGPVYGGTGWSSYHDTRSRRLAASETPDELLAHWAYLDGGQYPPPVPWPDAAGCALIAGLMVQDLLRAFRGASPAWTQWGISVDPFDLEAHPVLPLPRTSPR